MEFEAIPQAQWPAFQDLQPATAQIREKCLTILSLFEDLLTRSTLLGDGAVSIERTSHDSVIANIRSVLGNGRITLSWASEGTDLLGIMLFERACRDKYDMPYWEAIWGLEVPRLGDPYCGLGENAVRIQLNAHFEEDRRSHVMSGLISILHGLANGPVVAKK
jgi:hypothetical protein